MPKMKLMSVKNNKKITLNLNAHFFVELIFLTAMKFKINEAINFAHAIYA